MVIRGPARQAHLPESPTNHWAGRGPLVAFEVFVGLGGILGGMEMLRQPLTPMGMTPELIKASPFTTYTWPGVLLLTLLGIAPLALAMGVLAGARVALPLSGVFGLGLMAWICVQWALIPDRLGLQWVMFGIGLVVLGLSAILHRRHSVSQ